MAGGHPVHAVFQRVVQHGAELDGAVAGHAGVGSAAGQIFGRELVHHAAAEGIGQIENPVFDAQGLADAAGVVNVPLHARAGGGGQTAAAQAQGDAGDGAALPLQDQGGHRAVHAAAHAHQNMFHSVPSYLT